ncbi:superoxide dismutase [Tuwongella immobilis]|uniref:Superoxide dismutase n=1 Tax=Tuwongella immobilis TaxID=692036 RepID=A0A6C2YKS4_9BACT|nr:superoxide dismutase [Tuwongella immobilis]VIP01512.1 superoxide dismutase : Superoxide dismutase OS=Roseiflexus castenholzii (strain DSM 13941 / HLO8) GN=Rcas_3725 PE=3 SV=1: Sod_Fe_N: Sod_Fe_C [Tuwongella immobilis]VTR98628.1 superoxide dismutase : Superoxide dismutase OS=Roseiflexus castenholzii (strain DSM 13941 / HLO8) GN=Rcas_3725 PE=3 SV=1: Sod_Fe_N: Sod_Fe_C [Tuwongella immobilis]
MAHTLPALPYAPTALEPNIDAMTMEIHHGRHHKAYVDNLNKALEAQADLAALSITDLLRGIDKVPAAIKQAVINNGGGHANHALFWTIMAPNAGGEPTGPLADAINAAFGDFATLKAKVKENALGQFGSGWSWVVWDGSKLVAVKKPNQDSPLMEGHTPILGIDVWEHAYYLKYQNKRADYVDAWWGTVNWAAVAELFANAKAGK